MSISETICVAILAKDVGLLYSKFSLPFTSITPFIRSYNLRSRKPRKINNAPRIINQNQVGTKMIKTRLPAPMQIRPMLFRNRYNLLQ